MNIIFLDIDGVLNNFNENEKSECLPDSPIHFYMPRCVRLFNKIVEETDAKIVVSSTWRLGETLESITEKLEKIGVVGNIIGMTPSYLGGNTVRGNEILAWIREHEDLLGYKYYNFNTYIILDDDSDMLLWQADNYIKVDGFSGLTGAVQYQAVRKLKSLKNIEE